MPQASSSKPQDGPQPEDDEKSTKDRSGDAGLLPEQDAGPTDAEKYSRDEKDHGRQDYGP
jgi:hypothetical protein